MPKNEVNRKSSPAVLPNRLAAVAALIAYLARFCAVPKAAVALVSGYSSRSKRVRIEGVDAALREKLRTLDTGER